MRKLIRLGRRRTKGSSRVKPADHVVFDDQLQTMMTIRRREEARHLGVSAPRGSKPAGSDLLQWGTRN